MRFELWLLLFNLLSSLIMITVTELGFIMTSSSVVERLRRNVSLISRIISAKTEGVIHSGPLSPAGKVRMEEVKRKSPPVFE